MNITRDQFQAYEDVRQSGVTNMFDCRTVQRLSGLSKDEIVEIMKRYSELHKLYLGGE
jgi:hypothetical protein